MKTANSAILLASVLLATLTTVRADSFSSDTKHTSTVVRSHANSSTSSIDYAKYSWLSADDSSATASVNHIVVSLVDQRLYAYNGQQLVAWSNVSSGRPGHETPTGSFVVSEKDPDHHSSLYANASMPYFMRLTDGGVGLHAGELPGYPASHGCVRLPLGMARELYQHVESGTSVDIIDSSVTASVTQTAPVRIAQD